MAEGYPRGLPKEAMHSRENALAVMASRADRLEERARAWRLIWRIAAAAALTKEEEELLWSLAASID